MGEIQALNPASIFPYDNRITSGMVDEALEDALRQQTPSDAVQAFTQTLTRKLAQGDLHPLEGNTTELLQACTSQTGKLPVTLETTRLKTKLYLLLMKYDAGQIPQGEQHYAICIDKETQQAIPGLTKKCYGQYINERIINQLLGNKTLTTYMTGCMAGTILCEVVYRGGITNPASLAAAAVLGAGEGAVACGIPTGLAAVSRGNIAEELKKTGDVTRISLATQAFIPVLTGLTVAGLAGGKYKLLVSKRPDITVRRAAELLEKYSEAAKAGKLPRFVGPEYRLAEKTVENYVKQLEPYLPEEALKGMSQAQKAKFLLSLDERGLSLLYMAKQAGIQDERRIGSLVEALASGDSAKLREALGELMDEGGFKGVLAGEEVEKAAKRAAVRDVFSKLAGKEIDDLAKLTDEDIDRLASELANRKYGQETYSVWEKKRQEYKNMLKRIKENPDQASEELKRAELGDIAKQVDKTAERYIDEAAEIIKEGLLEGEEKALKIIENKRLAKELAEAIKGRLGILAKPTGKFGKILREAAQMAAKTGWKAELAKTLGCTALGFTLGTLAATPIIDRLPTIQTLTLKYDGNHLIVENTQIGG